MENKEKEVKPKKSKQNIAIKAMACFIIATMILAPCSTFIYYLLAGAQ